MKGSVLSDDDLDQLVAAHEEHRRRVFGVCLAYLADPGAAEDATQETFVRAAPRLGGLPEREAGRYLMAVARHIAVDELRWRRSQSRMRNQLRGVEWSLDPEAGAIDRRLVQEVWDGLSHRDRVLFLCRFGGYSYEEIAERLGVSVGAVGMALLRARQRARRLLALGGLVAPVGRWWRRRAGALGKRRGPAPRPGGWVSTAWRSVVARLLLVGLAYPLVVLPGARQGAGAHAAPAAVGPAAESGSVTNADVAFTDAAVSPAYEADHTLLAIGHLARCGSAPPCTRLVTSHDGGHTWQRLPATGLTGSALLLPADGSIFAMGPDGLQVSRDGGRSFSTVAQIPGPAAMAPRSTSGDVGVAIGAQPLWLYDSTAARLVRGPDLPDGMTGVIDLRRAGRALLVTGRRVLPEHPQVQTQVVIRCDSVHCGDVLTLTDGAPLRLGAVPADEAGAAVAFSATGVELSRDGGRSFTALQDSNAVQPVAAAIVRAPGGVIPRLLVLGVTAHGVRAVVSDTAGRSYGTADLGQDLGRPGWLLPLPDGRVMAGLAGPDALGRWGLRCSSDGGLLWTAAC